MPIHVHYWLLLMFKHFHYPLLLMSKCMENERSLNASGYISTQTVLSHVTATKHTISCQHQTISHFKVTIHTVSCQHQTISHVEVSISIVYCLSLLCWRMYLTHYDKVKIVIPSNNGSPKKHEPSTHRAKVKIKMKIRIIVKLSNSDSIV